MGKKNSRKKGLSKVEQGLNDKIALGWAFTKHYKTKGGIKFLIGVKATKDPFEVTGSTLASVLDEIDKTDFDKLLEKHNLKKIEPAVPKEGNVFIDGEYVGKVVSMDTGNNPDVGVEVGGIIKEDGSMEVTEASVVKKKRAPRKKKVDVEDQE